MNDISIFNEGLLTQITDTYTYIFIFYLYRSSITWVGNVLCWCFCGSLRSAKSQVISNQCMQPLLVDVGWGDLMWREAKLWLKRSNTHTFTYVPETPTWACTMVLTPNLLRKKQAQTKGHFGIRSVFSQSLLMLSRCASKSTTCKTSVWACGILDDYFTQAYSLGQACIEIAQEITCWCTPLLMYSSSFSNVVCGVCKKLNGSTPPISSAQLNHIKRIHWHLGQGIIQLGYF